MSGADRIRLLLVLLLPVSPLLVLEAGVLAARGIQWIARRLVQ